MFRINAYRVYSFQTSVHVVMNDDKNSIINIRKTRDDSLLMPTFWLFDSS